MIFYVIYFFVIASIVIGAVEKRKHKNVRKKNMLLDVDRIVNEDINTENIYDKFDQLNIIRYAKTYVGEKAAKRTHNDDFMLLDRLIHENYIASKTAMKKYDMNYMNNCIIITYGNHKFRNYKNKCSVIK